jgi:hypothetical protein
MALTAEAYDTAAVQNAVRGAVRSPSAMPRPLYRCYGIGELDVVPLSVATGNGQRQGLLHRSLYSHHVVVTLKQWPLPCEARQMVVDPFARSAEASRIVQARLPICTAIVTQFVTHFARPRHPARVSLATERSSIQIGH